MAEKRRRKKTNKSAAPAAKIPERSAAAPEEPAKKRVHVYAVTGKSGSGKSRLASRLAERLGCERIDIDKVGHQAILDPEIIERTRKAFGDGVVNEDGSLNRKAVGRVVFNSDERMAEYVDITWSYMSAVLDGVLARTEGPVVFEWVRLPITGKYWDDAETKILVRADRERRKKAVLERDGITADYFDQRDTKSVDYDRFTYDAVVENDYRPETIERAVERILREFPA